MDTRTCTRLAAAIATLALVPATLAGGGLETTQELSYSFPLSPGSQVLSFDQFDDNGGNRVLQSVTMSVDGTAGANVTAENESTLPAPDFALTLGGFMTVDFASLATFTIIDEAFLTDGSVAASDGIPGGGPDFWDFGFVSGAVADDATTTSGLASFVGAGTIDAVVAVNGGFSLSGTTDATIIIDGFVGEGVITITYAYEVVAGACCLPNGACQELAEDACFASGGNAWQGDIRCADANCPAGEVGGDPRGTCTEKGSLLVFSKVEILWDGDGNLVQDTFISITNDMNQDVAVQLYFINGDPPLAADPVTGERAHAGWNWVDNQITLTANEPTYWSALSGQPKGVSPFTVVDPGFPPGRPSIDNAGKRMLRGYIVGWAVNRDNQEIRWNHLSGHGTIVNYVRSGSAWEYNACAYAAVDPAIANGQPTGTPGEINLDGLEYAQAFNELLVNFQAVGSAAFSGPRLVISDTDLTLHPVEVDLRQETVGPVTTKASFNVWNMNEVKFSGLHRCVTCWDETLASRYD
ncbi:MAG: choice-of-anchor E domain-containing protein, partial [Phycisphaerales bacterium]|nr:choice-of-anchor E domain-containing protein [Phycisphaerales bacterium]